MPEKSLTIATYAAGSALLAISLVYVFGPTFLFDDETSGTSDRKKGVVGLSNAANDCFINSVLQALAGSRDLRLYLIRENHRRRLDGPEVYRADPDQASSEGNGRKSWNVEGLQKGLVTHALKEILDRLNERPLYRKTISPQPFIRALERALGGRISRQQQDAQEFLHIVMERLCDEYHAGKRVRKQSLKNGVAVTGDMPDLESLDITEPLDPNGAQETEDPEQVVTSAAREESAKREEGFPFEGKTSSQIQCLTCGFKPKPSVSAFVTLTLNVPQQASTSLNSCFDGMLKVEHIDDFKCDKCGLEHALRYKIKELSRTASPDVRRQLESDVSKIRASLDEDPETPPPDVELPNTKLAPRSRIARHMYISTFPKVLAVHLSRSVFSHGSIPTKNLAKVAFPEALPLGGILDQKKYRLMGIIAHKGSHNSGHYETFRRQVIPEPFSTPHSFGATGAYSVQGSPNPSAVQSPRMSAANLLSDAPSSRGSSAAPSPATASPARSTPSLLSETGAPLRDPPPKSSPRDLELQPPSSSSSSKPRSVRSIKSKAASIGDAAGLKRKQKRSSNRWWRISDDKIKESKTSEVLGMQKEVFLLFYELEG